MLFPNVKWIMTKTFQWLSLQWNLKLTLAFRALPALGCLPILPPSDGLLVLCSALLECWRPLWHVIFSFIFTVNDSEWSRLSSDHLPLASLTDLNVASHFWFHSSSGRVWKASFSLEEKGSQPSNKYTLVTWLLVACSYFYLYFVFNSRYHKGRGSCLYLVLYV